MEQEAHDYVASTIAAINEGSKFDGSVTLAATQVSIAISLKRIADALTTPAEKGFSVFELVERIAQAAEERFRS